MLQGISPYFIIICACYEVVNILMCTVLLVTTSLSSKNPVSLVWLRHCLVFGKIGQKSNEHKFTYVNWNVGMLIVGKIGQKSNETRLKIIANNKP